MIFESPTHKANRGGSSAGVVAVLALAVVGGGVYLASNRPERPTVAKEDRLAQVAALARAEKDAEFLQRAIREQRAIIGMTTREVESAKGRPTLKRRGDDLSADERVRGATESWVYNAGTAKESSVVFGANGLVISSSDVGD